ncbi:MAG TPA: carboxypeptidase-like regulatory domain-containing protein [Vicinamibacterales bacterium]|nr:carboxypeptidase-like regulatory domain-containing protein [Vicinamibacterales bacterium]
MCALLLCLLLATDAPAGGAQGVIGGGVGSVPQAPPRDPRAKPATGSGSIAGRVTAADTGDPMRRALVNLNGLQRPRSTYTDFEGRYQFTSLPPGSYNIFVNPGSYRAGYQPTAYGASGTGLGPMTRPKPIELADGQRVDNVDVALQRTGVIAGRVTDAEGGPAARVQVGAWRVLPGTEPSQAGSAQTDDLGQFRLFNLAPGDYFVMANPPHGGSQADVEGESVGFAPTYAPGTPVRSEAMRLRVARGAQVSADIRLVETRVYSVSGTIVSSRGEPLSHSSVMLMRAEGSAPTFGTGVSPAGAFTIHNVPPGAYELVARYAPARAPGTVVDGPEQGQEFASVKIEVGTMDVDGVVLVTRPGATVTGEIVFEDAPREGGRVNLNVQATERRMFMGAPAVEVKENTFTLRNVFTDVVIRGAAGGGPAWGLKAVRLRGKDITDVPTTFTSADSGHLEVVFTAQAPALEGVVTDDAGKPVEDASIVIFGHDPSTWRPQSSYYRRGRVMKGGKFLITGLREGRYYAVAVPPDLMMNAQPTTEMLESLSKVATAVTLNQGERRPVDLVLVRLQ